jgi:predicted nicotinamide N-methyase|tara:strand:+ start:188 stop:982 length:795 start_codon:yes stop_codon:yes gene_type:complete|eukprot:g9000.t1
MFGDLFNQVEYVERKVTFNAVENEELVKRNVSGEYPVNLYISKSSTTELHLTGQVLWPVTNLLCWYCLVNKDFFKGKHVVELGAGVGLAGMFCGLYCQPKTMTVTDGEPEIVELIERNVKHSQKTNRLGDNTAAMSLFWGKEGDVERCVTAFREKSSSPQATVDIVIGADILARALCDPKYPLEAAKDLLIFGEDETARGRTKQFICAYNIRSESSLQYVIQTATSTGFKVVELNICEFLPKPWPEKLESNADTMRFFMFELTL